MMHQFILDILKLNRKGIFYFICLSIMIGIVDLCTVYLMSNVLQSTSEKPETLSDFWGDIDPYYLYLYCFVFLFMKVTLHLLYKASLPFFIYRLQMNIRDKVFGNIYDDFTDRVDSSSFSENYFKLNAASTHVSINMFFPLFQLFLDFIVCTIIVIFIVSQQPLLSTVVIVFLAVFFTLWTTLTKKISTRLGEKRNRALEDATQWTRFANDHHIQFKSLNIINDIKLQYNAAVRDYSDNMAKFKIISDLPRVFFEFMIIFFILACLFILSASNFQLGYSTNMDETLALLFLLPRILPFLNSFTTVLNTIANQKDSIEILSNIYYKPNKCRNNSLEDVSSVNVAYHDLVIRNGEVVVKKFSDLKLKAGNLYCVVGASGSGKSTLVKSLAGLNAASDGGVYIEEMPQVSALQELSGYVAFCPQTISEVDISVYQFLKLGFQGDVKRIDEVHNRVSLGEFSIDDNITELSGGQRQRVLIAKTILHTAFMYIFDEPTSGLDQLSSIKIIEYIKQELQNSIILCVTHDATLMGIADEVIRIEDVH